MKEAVGNLQVIGTSLLEQVRADEKRAEGTDLLELPRTPVEETLCEICAEVLQLERVGIRDNFFELGGNSLMATQALVRIHEVFQIDLELRYLFETPTVEGLATQIETALKHSARPPLVIPTVARDGCLPLSFTQERMWFLHQLDPNGVAYHIVVPVQFSGQLDEAALLQSLNELVKRQESLRTTFSASGSEAVQIIAPALTLPLPVVDLRHLPPEDRTRVAQELGAHEANRPFDLGVGPLLRATLYRLGETDYIFLLVMHHIISDAWSLRVIFQELTVFYNAAVSRETPQLPALPIQPADFAVWQRNWMQGELLEAELSYWRNRLRNIPVLDLPTDRPRPAVQTYRGARQSVELNSALVDELLTLSKRESTTLSMTLLTAFKILLQRYTAQDDIAVGMSIANRQWLAAEGLINAFVNTLVLRTDLSGGPTFRQLLKRVREVSLEAYAHQDMPFAKLVAELNPERRLDQSPLVQVMFNFINLPLPRVKLQGLEAGGGVVELHHGGAQFDLSFTGTFLASVCHLSFEYNTDLFDEATINRMLGHLTRLLEAIVGNPDNLISTLPLLTENESRQLISDWNQTEAAYPELATLPELFEAQVKRTPQAVAVRLGSDQLTYQDLNARANQLARYLQGQGVGRGVYVGVCLERSLQMVVALLGILKTGAAYIPLDPSYPISRLEWMLADSKAPIVLTQAHLAGQFTGQTHCLALETAWPMIAQESEAALPPAAKPDDPAYVIYTSGSTGIPKGVVALHHNTINRCQWMWEAYPFTPNDVCCQKTPLSFVDSVWEIFGPLLRGVPLVIVPDEVLQDPFQFIAALASNNVTRVVLVPSLLRILLNTYTDLAARLPKLVLGSCSGETLDPELCRLFYQRLPHATLLNLYGSSEVAGDVTCFNTRHSLDEFETPIGRPIANTQIYLLDSQLQPVPIGVSGDIFVGGAGLALGYMGNSDLNAERFLPNPFSSTPGARLYKTGDVGRYRSDGNILYLGRRDQQIKIRGMRVELAEVQSVLSQYPAVEETVVIAQDHPEIGKRLIACVVARSNATIDCDSLQHYLRERLPSYMVPSLWIQAPAIPRLPNGKVDRPALTRLSSNPPASKQARTMPRTTAESKMAQLWAETLGRSSIGLNDNFFELGGHSLLAASLFVKIKEMFGVDLPLTSIFRSPTVASLTQVLTAPPQLARRPASLVAIQPNGTRRPLFCIHPLGGGVADYAAIAQHLDPAQPFYGLRAKGLDDLEYAGQSIEELAADYLNEIRSQQTGAPYWLGGYSSGGLIAFEMARQLQANGEDVELVALLDSYAPKLNQSHPLRLEALRNFLRGFPHWLGDFVGLGPKKILARLQRKLRTTSQSHGQADLRDFLDGEPEQLPPAHRQFMQTHYRAILAYKPQPYPGRITLFRAKAQALSRITDPDKGWGDLALGGVEIREFEGSHHTLFREPYVRDLATQLENKLREIS